MSENKKLSPEEIQEVSSNLIKILEKAASREEEYGVVTKRGIDYLVTELGCTPEEALATIKYTVKRIIEVEMEHLEAVSKQDEPDTK